MQLGDDDGDETKTVKCLVPRSNRASIMGFSESACRKILVSDEQGIACIEFSYEKSTDTTSASQTGKHSHRGNTKIQKTSKTKSQCYDNVTRNASSSNTNDATSSITNDATSSNTDGASSSINNAMTLRTPNVTTTQCCDIVTCKIPTTTDTSDRSELQDTSSYTTTTKRSIDSVTSSNTLVVEDATKSDSVEIHKNASNVNTKNTDTCSRDTHTNTTNTDSDSHKTKTANADSSTKNSASMNTQRKIHATFTITYIDMHTLAISKQQTSHQFKHKEKFRLNVFLSRGVLCAVWVHHNQCTCWNFNNALSLPNSALSSSNDTAPVPVHFHTEENLEKAFYINLDHEYLVVSSKDEDFLDSVFSSDDASLRMTSYYSCTETGVRFNSKSVIGQILEQDPLVHVSDILFLDIPFSPKWMVMEWSLPEMTLSQIYFYRIEHNNSSDTNGSGNIIDDGGGRCGNDDRESKSQNTNTTYDNRSGSAHTTTTIFSTGDSGNDGNPTTNPTLVRDGIINFKHDFSIAEYQAFFGKTNQLQSKVVVSRAPPAWRAFLWVSWNHVVIVNLENYDIVGILRTNDLTRFKDFRNELHDFQLELTTTRVCQKLHQRVMLYVKKDDKDIVHFSRFNL